MSTAEKAIRPVLIAGEWRQAKHEHTFKASDPNKNELLPVEFPVSHWEDCDAALDAAAEAAHELRQLPRKRLLSFWIAMQTESKLPKTLWLTLHTLKLAWRRVPV